MSVHFSTAVCLMLSVGCIDRDPMQLQERPDVYRASRFFEDGRVMRPSVPNTLSQEGFRTDTRTQTARTQDGGWVNTLPAPASREMMRAGRANFEIYCSPCHGVLADGNGPVAQKMTLRPPPALVGMGAHPHRHDGTQEPPLSGPGDLPHALGFYFAAISDGYGLMPSYADALTPAERWGIVAYLRALSLSQSTPIAELPSDVQARLLKEAP